MATKNIEESLSEAPPLKRARLEKLDELIGTPQDIMDDMYGTEGNTPAYEVSNHSPVENTKTPSIVNSIATMGIPGLGLLGQAHSGDQGVKLLDTHSGINPSNLSEHAVNVSNGSPRVDDERPSHLTTALEAHLGGLTEPAPDDKAPEVYGLATQSPHKIEGNNVEIVNDSLSGGINRSNDVTTNTIMLGGGMISQDVQEALPQEMVDGDMEGVDNEAEFEVDLSPIESSSDESSSDESSSDDSDEDAYKLLGPEEQARILMEGDGGSDDEGGKGPKGQGGQLRTKNEVPEEVIPKPNVTITGEMKIEELGAVEGIIENILLIKAKISGEYRVLESGSVLCLADRSVIGVVSETLGRVQQPLYSVRFTNADEIRAAGCVFGTKIYYSEQHSTYVFTQSLKVYKGSDASNLHDEEVGDEEVEFSDDEAEAEHKRRLKQKKNERREERMQGHGGSTRGGHPPPQHAAYDASVGLSYDDEDEGPYKPLARPAGFADTMGRSEAPQEGAGYAGRTPRGGREYHSSRPNRDSHNRGRGGRGGRGDGGRGRDGGRGGRGRGSGGVADRRPDEHGRWGSEYGVNSHHAASPFPRSSPGHTPHGYQQHHVPQPQHQQQPSPGHTPHRYQQHHVPPPPPPQPFPSPQPEGFSSFAHVHPSYPAAPFHQAPTGTHGGGRGGGGQEYAAGTTFPRAPQTPQTGWPQVGTGGGIPSGAFLNPAFFGPGPVQTNGGTEKAFQDAQAILRRLREGGGG